MTCQFLGVKTRQSWTFLDIDRGRPKDLGPGRCSYTLLTCTRTYPGLYNSILSIFLLMGNTETYTAR